MASVFTSQAYIAKVCRSLEQRERADKAIVLYAQQLFSIRAQPEPNRGKLAQLVSEIEAAAPSSPY